MRILLCLLLLASAKAIAQPIPVNTADKLADALTTDDADLDYEELYENLLQLTAHPFNINTATTEMLLSLNILSPEKVNSIVDYIRNTGELMELYELQAIPLIEPEDAHALLPFIRIAPVAPAKSFLGRVRDQQSSYFFTRYERTLETSKGFRSGDGYLGDPGRWYSRFSLTSPKDLSVGFTAEKDAGERFSWNASQKGFDFYSGHVQLMNKGVVNNLVAGDYTAQFGQGLTLGGGFGIGKGSETITTLRRNSSGFMPYSSANESGFFRGGAVSISLPLQLQMHSFWSSLPRDISSAGSESLAVLQSGKHRTVTEIAGRHGMKETNAGVALELKRRSFHVGSLFHRTHFDLPVSKTTTLYNTFDFRGTTNTNIGLFGACTFQNFSMFGEASRTIGSGNAWLWGILAGISRSVDVSLLIRSFDRNYHTFYSNAISENTTPRNEQGIYWGMKHAINKRLSYTTYTDLFRFPWIKFRNYIPSAGSESLIRVTYRLSRSAEFYAQFRDERKSRNAADDRPEYRTMPTRRQNLAINASITDGHFWTKARVQYSSWRQDGRTEGFAVALDAGLDWDKVSLSSRFALFDTDDFDNRQYMNERDVLMAFSFPTYSGEGTRSCLVARWRPARWLDIWAKFGMTRYFSATSSGSGNDLIEGNTRRDVKLEGVLRF